MPGLFHYEGRDKDGHTVKGDLEVNSIDDVISHLERHHITPIDIEAIKKRAVNLHNLLHLSLGRNKADDYDVMNFCRQLAALNNAGIPLIKAISQLAQSSESRLLRKILTVIADDIAAGFNLGTALKKQHKIFSPIVIDIINVGENTGHLNEALLQLGNYLESTIANRRRLLSAIRYPSLVIIMALAAMVIMNFFVIPKFMVIFSNFKIQLPLATQIIMRMSNFMTNNWKILVAIMVCTFLIGLRLLKIVRVRYFWDKYKLAIPIFGNLQKRIVLSQFTWTFSLILRSGIPIIQGMTMASESIGNSYFSKKLLTIRDAINHGENFSQSAKASGLFTPNTIQMIEVGEESGKLDELLNSVAKYYDAEVDYDLRRLNELIEPVLLTIIGAMILILALGIYLPMWDLVQAIKK